MQGSDNERQAEMWLARASHDRDERISCEEVAKLAKRASRVKQSGMALWCGWLVESVRVQLRKLSAETLHIAY